MNPTPSIQPASSSADSSPARLSERMGARHTTDTRTARDVVFYRLGRKFVDNERSIPEDVQSALYYTLAIGHHTGVIDCLDPRIGTSREVFGEVLALLGDGEASAKLAGVERFGEIQIDKEHVGVLREVACAALAEAGVEAFSGASGHAGGVGDGVAGSGERAGAEAHAGAVASSARPYVYAMDALAWLEEFVALLDEVAREPQVYAMGRRVTP